MDQGMAKLAPNIGRGTALAVMAVVAMAVAALALIGKGVLRPAHAFSPQGTFFLLGALLLFSGGIFLTGKLRAGFLLQIGRAHV